MQILVRTKKVNINVRGLKKNSKIVKAIKNEYGEKIKIIENKEDELIPVRESDWYKKMVKKKTPGMAMRVYRDNMGLTQSQLGEKLGGISRQNISGMENDRRPISKKLAKELSKLFGTSIDKFL